MTGLDYRLTRTDHALLVGICVVLFGYSLVDDRVLTTHEAVHCQNVREMLETHEWFIPTYGGRPWLERPPLPHWCTAVFVQVLGRVDESWTYRVGSIVAGTAGVLLTAWMTAMWFGRWMGVLAGAILATMREYAAYAVGPECDIFLCLLILIALALTAHLEFRQRPSVGESVGFLGSRPWLVFALFGVWGLTNMAKGLIFGSVYILIPLSVFLLWNADWGRIRRYVTLWGWMVFGIAAAAWPLLAYWSYPDIVDLWMSDYAGRLNRGFMREPIWYYAVQLPWIVFPWTIAAVVGVVATARRACNERYSAERFLWSWALIVPICFSLPQGKHHHYLLHCMAPWAVLSALGARRLWEMQLAAPRWLRRPVVATLVLGVPIAAALGLVRHHVPGPEWLIPCLMVGAPLCVLAGWWSATHADARVAFGGLMTLIVALHCAGWSHRTRYLDRYAEDSRFLSDLRQAPLGGPLYVAADRHPLDASWLLFYTANHAGLLHNLSFLRDDRIEESEVFVLTRAYNEKLLWCYGEAVPVAQSNETRGEHSPQDRWTLFRLRFHEDLVRHRPLRISPMQATGRAFGPYLD